MKTIWKLKVEKTEIKNKNLLLLQVTHELEGKQPETPWL